jgi:putative ABC transport system permease protein
VSWLRRLLNIFRSDRISRDIDREMAFHLEERVDELRARGMPEHEARDTARRQFGNLGAQAEDTREADISGWAQSVAGDVRYGLRALRHSPIFALVAIASLGLGIGANATIFTLIDELLLQPLPVAAPDELMIVATSDDPGGDSYFTNPLWEQVRDRQDAFTSIATFGETSFNLAEGGEIRRARGLFVNGDYFATFAVQPAVGRLITRGDDVRGCGGLAVLGHRFWQREYGGARDVVGRRISLAGRPFEVIGVADASFRGADVGREADVYAPLCSEALIRGPESQLDRRSSWWLRSIGRLAPGMTPEQAGARLAAIARASHEATVPQQWEVSAQEEYVTRSFWTFPASRGFSDLREQYRPALLVLMAGVGIVLLIACANVANLLLSRAEARRQELAIRMAIGAARMRLVRQLLTESLLLAVAGAALGLLIARVGAPAMVRLISPGVGRDTVALDTSLDWRVLAFTIAVTATTVLVFGLIPAWRATRVSVHSAMMVQGRGVVGRTRNRLGRLLVVAQVALSLILVVAAGLLVGTFRNLSQVNPGFTPERVLTVLVALRATGMPPEQYATTTRRVRERIASIPGVERVSGGQLSPVGGSSWNNLIVLDGVRPNLAKGEGIERSLSWFNEVTPGYFATIGTRLLAGRDFDAGDVPGAPRVAIVNDAFVRKFFGDANPLGRRFQVPAGDTLAEPLTIVGVVENSKYRTLREEVQPIVYQAESQPEEPASQMWMFVRTAGNPAALAGPIRDAVREIHPAIALEFLPLARQLAESLRRERLLAVLSGLFGALALGLAMLGLYGVMAYAVVRRRTELGVRLALGASRAQVVRLILGEVMRIVVVGVLVGGAGAIAATKVTTAFLYGVQRTDPGVYVVSALMLAAVAIAAGWVPAWRASRVDPLKALREQ